MRHTFDSPVVMNEYGTILYGIKEHKQQKLEKRYCPNCWEYLLGKIILTECPHCFTKLFYDKIINKYEFKRLKRKNIR